MSRSTFTALTAALALAAATAVASGTPADARPAAGERSEYVPIAPCGLPIVKLKKKRQAVVPVVGRCGVPADAVAVALAIQAKGSTPGALRAWASGSSVPRTPVLAWSAARKAVATQASVALGGGQVTLAGTKGRTRVDADVVGYYRRVPTSHTLAISPWAMVLTGSTTAGYGTTNGCVTNFDNTTTASGSVPLTLPVGSRITSVTASVYDGTSADTYSLNLVRYLPTPTGLTSDSTTPLGSGGAGSIVVTTTTTPVNLLIDAQHTFAITMSNLRNFNNGLCSLQVTYEDPA
ncbi:hypothetical protein [Nocardioides nitrophenolicus]|uniref:hypothetical protein n=1 Tax=Nocardioides nitrophenolicus TaxID=60489 RepID=UPI00195D8CEC|nr:hypothetical protein [Nocardioides nitrophenolicus]MBM7519522.1 hypothetical protein [Nocardioides nitrophenolicus]